MLSYAEYYKLCREKYNQENDNKQKLSLYDLTMNYYHPNQNNEYFTFPDNYLDLIDSLSKKIDTKVKDPSQLYSDHNGNDLAIQVKNIYDLPEINEITNHILPQIEQSVFNSHILLSGIHAYRNVKTEVDRKSSWLWHYDNNPKEAVKILIYLTDVEEDTGPFEMLKHDELGTPKVPTSRTGYQHWSPPVLPESRVPAYIMEEHEQMGYKKHKITGPKGTLLFFDNNIIHRANIPDRLHRDVIILNIRPTLEKFRPYMSKETTGTWGHKSPIMDPAQVAPILN